MDIFKFYRTIKPSDPSVVKSFKQLKNVYKIIPETKGCIENISKEKGCGGWCCKIQSPQFLYIEFLHIWQFIKENWSGDEICDIIHKSMLNVIKGDTTKGCVFFDNETKKCKIHEVRGYACRLYGITPEKEFKVRYERMKELYKSVPGAVVKEQCNLIKTIDDKKVTVFNTSRWWSQLIQIEKKIGIKEEDISDKQGGSYRMPHDHILLFTMPENILSALAGISLYDNANDKIVAVSDLMGLIKNHFRGNDERQKNSEN